MAKDKGQNGEEILKRARRAVSLRVPYALRDDISQDLVLAYLNDEISLDEMDARARTLVNKHLRSVQAAKTVSLNEPAYEDSAVTRADTLTEAAVARSRLMIYYGSGKGFVSLASCVECRAPLFKVGRTSADKPRYRCVSCGFNCTQAVSRDRYFDDETQLTIFRLLREGKSIRDVAKKVGMNANTVMKYRKLLRPDEIAPCGCGKTAGHRGWCWWRLKQKPQRRNFMRKIKQPSARPGAKSEALSVARLSDEP